MKRGVREAARHTQGEGAGDPIGSPVPFSGGFALPAVVAKIVSSSCDRQERSQRRRDDIPQLRPSIVREFPLACARQDGTD